MNDGSFYSRGANKKPRERALRAAAKNWIVATGGTETLGCLEAWFW
jgi:hypothetical protein